MLIMKWKKIILLTILLGSFFAAGVYAADGIKKVEAFVRSDFNVFLNSSKVNLKDPLLVYDGKSYLPVRALADLLGVEIIWLEQKKSILLVINTKSTESGTGTGTGPSLSPSPSPSPSPGTGTNNLPTSPELTSPAPPTEIEIRTFIKYYVNYNNMRYPLLAAEYKGTLFFRFYDVAAMGLDMTNIRLSTDKLTKELFIAIDELAPKWNSPLPSFVIAQEALIYGETDTGKITAFNNYFNNNSSLKAHTINSLGNNNYLLLLQNGLQFYHGTITLTKNLDHSYGITSFSLHPLVLTN